MIAYIVTERSGELVTHTTLTDFRQSDWGAEPRVLVQPVTSSKTNIALQAAADDDTDYALILGADARVCRHLRHNIETLPIIRRGQADLLALFVPDVIPDPWERSEPHLGYRVVKPRDCGPNGRWEKYRRWGTEAYVLSRRMVRECLTRPDVPVALVCHELGLPVFCSAPCWVEHVPAVTAFGPPTAYAPDFDPDFKLVVGPGFQPPECIPGTLSDAEGRQLYALAAGRTVLELGTAYGRATVCLAQQGAGVVTVDAADQSAARWWVGKYERPDRVTFHAGRPPAVLPGLSADFDLVVLDADHSGAHLARDLGLVLPLLAPCGLLAVRGYPNPDRWHVRPVVDDHARRLGWKRVNQTDSLGVFRTAGREQVLSATDADVREWFRPRWTPAEQSRAAELMRATGAALAAAGVGWLVYGGTLLGQVISASPLPWDDDLDVLTVGRPDEKRLATAAERHGLRVARLPNGMGWKFCLAADATPARVGFPFVDVGVGEVDGAEFVHQSFWGGFDRFPLAEVLPLGGGAFDGVTVSLPADPVAVCRRKYGPNCLTSAIPPQWDHRQEAVTGYPTLRVPLDRIRRLNADPPE